MSGSQRIWTVAVLGLLVAVGWALFSDPATTATTPSPSGHTHAGGAAVSLLVGDGRDASRAGYRLAGVRVPARAGEAGEVSFRILYDGRPVRRYLTEQTKDLHLYLVRRDLSVFRHLHPTMAAAGTWSARVTLPASGDYRVLTEFIARDAGGEGDHLMLGTVASVAGPSVPAPDVDDGSVKVRARGPLRVGADGSMSLLVSDAAGRPLSLGSYLGASAHVTGFRTSNGAAVHMHPLGQPRPTGSGTALTFHTEFAEAGDYRVFVQVRVDGLLHTVPVTLTVAPARRS